MHCLLVITVYGRKFGVSGEVFELGKYSLLDLYISVSSRLCSDELLVCYMHISISEIRLFFLNKNDLVHE